jgi:hypothetical protein
MDILILEASTSIFSGEERAGDPRVLQSDIPVASGTFRMSRFF